MRRTPQLAEHLFAAMCSDHGVICNKATEDETGWDFVVDLPYHIWPTLPVDMQPSGSSCLIQIKSTTLGKPNTRIKLSNAMRFASAPLPCFVVLFVYANDGEHLGTYVSHFWKDEIAKTIEMVRRSAAEGDKALHKRSLTMNFSGSNPADDPIEKIIAEVAAVPNYAETKRSIFQWVGFEDGLGEASIRFTESVTDERIIDAELGLGDPLEVSHFRFRTRRFGIDADPPLADFESGVLQIDAQPAGTCVVSLSSETDGNEIDIEANVYVPSRSSLPENLLKIRIISSIFDMSAKPYTGETNFKITADPQQRLPISDAMKLLRLRGMLATGNVDFQARKDNVPLLWGTVSNQPFNEHLAWSKVREFLKHILERVTSERLPPTARISLADLHIRIPAILEFLALVGSEPLQISAADDFKDFSIGSHLDIIHPAKVDFEGFTVCAIVQRSGRVYNKSNKIISFELGGGNCRRTLVLLDSPYTTAETIDKEISRVADNAAGLDGRPVAILPVQGFRPNLL